MREAIDIVWKLCVAAELVVAVRLLTAGLAGEYPALLTASCILPIKSLLLMFLFSQSGTYDPRQVAQQLAPLEWIVCAWIVFELFSRWTRSYKGIGRFGKLLMGALLTIALLISVAGWQREWEALVFRQNYRIYYILNRVIWGMLAVFVTGTWLFFRNYPVSIPPNTIRHTQIAVVYFTSNAICELVFTMNGLKYVQWVNLFIVITTAGSFAAWAILLTKKGQITPPARHISEADQLRIERLNQELLVFMDRFPKQNVKRTPATLGRDRHP